MKRSSWISMFLVVAACSDPKPMTTGINLGETDDDGEEEAESTKQPELTSEAESSSGEPPPTSGAVVTSSGNSVSAAHSHSASVGSRRPAQRHQASASK